MPKELLNVEDILGPMVFHRAIPVPEGYEADLH